MSPIRLHHVYDFNQTDREFWEEHFEHWLPCRLIDAHTHVMDPRFRVCTMSETKRRQYWVNEVAEPIDAVAVARCHETVFPNREVTCVTFGMPDLDFDLDRGNSYLQQECAARGWRNLVVIRPQWPQEKLATLLDSPGVIGVKPYYALISDSPETRDQHLEASIFDFLPHHCLEVVNDRHAWVTLHVPKAARLGHPENLHEVREIRRRYPNIVLVIAHLGRCYTQEHALEALPQFADDPGIFFDSSAVLNPASHRVALQFLGPQRILYGSDNPVMYMRGRRQYRGRTYVNRTNYPFEFNKEREPAEIEAAYTLFMYEDIRAIKQACLELGIVDRNHIEAIFHDNAARLIAGIEARKHNHAACAIK